MKWELHYIIDMGWACIHFAFHSNVFERSHFFFLSSRSIPTPHDFIFTANEMNLMRCAFKFQQLNRMKTHQFFGIQSEIQIERKTLCTFIYFAFIFISINSNIIWDTKIFQADSLLSKNGCICVWELFSLFLSFIYCFFSSILSFKMTEIHCTNHRIIFADLEIIVMQWL